MKVLIIYKSKTGFTKWYAEVIAKETEGNLIDFKDASAEIMSEYDVVVYGGGLYAGMINGYKKAKEMFEKSTAKRFIIFATGGTPNEATKEIDEVWNHNLSAEELKTIPHFYMQAGICYEKMSFSNRAIMKMMSKVLEKKKNKDSAEEGFAQAIKSSYDITSGEYAKPLIKCVLEWRLV